MRQYLELLQSIKDKGTYKYPAREGMPGTLSLFGYQSRYNLQDGFPILTTKKIHWKSVVIELLWFLRGDTNIKYLVDNGVNIWNEDAYNYYLKRIKNSVSTTPLSFESFIHRIKTSTNQELHKNLVDDDYLFGDCGYQYGKVWRNWDGPLGVNPKGGRIIKIIDQIKNVINSLKNNPDSRRHIVTAIDPAHDTDLALYWCHAMFQFNCRPLTNDQKIGYAIRNDLYDGKGGFTDETKIPKYYLDCQLYQRSCDVFLGVPFNISSYALLTEIIAKICNMIPGEFVHTYGDVHIYDNHKDQVEEQLTRIPTSLPKLILNDKIKWDYVFNNPIHNINEIFNYLTFEDFKLENYNPQDAIKGKLSTGLI